MIRLYAAALALFVFIPFAMAHHSESHGDAAAPLNIGPPINAPAPTISAVNIDGSPANIAAMTGSEGVILTFVRSVDWCPFCKKQLIALNAAEAELWGSGWQLVGLSYDSPEKLAEFTGKSNITFPLLSDADSATIKAFNLLNNDVSADSRSYGIPHPAIVFIANDGTVRAVLREEGYRTRPSLDAIKETIANFRP